MTNEELKAIEERAEKATPGPWDTLAASTVRAVKGDFAVPIFRSEAPFNWHTRKNLTNKVMCKAYADEVNNATFIAHARTDIPALLADRKALVEVLQLVSSVICLDTDEDNVGELARCLGIEDIGAVSDMCWKVRNALQEDR